MRSLKRTNSSERVDRAAEAVVHSVAVVVVAAEAEGAEAEAAAGEGCHGQARQLRLADNSKDAGAGDAHNRD